MTYLFAIPITQHRAPYLRRFVVMGVLLMGLLLSIPQSAAQNAEPTTPAQAAQVIEPLADTGLPVAITYPLAVNNLSGVVPIRGRVLAESLQSFFIEFRPLLIDPNETQAQADARPWFPATLPSNTPIADGELGRWNTQSIPDGLYELHLVVLDLAGNREVVRVSPLRVMNEIPNFLITPTVDRPPLLPTPTSLGSTGNNTGNNTGNATPDTTSGPTVTAVVDANVRRGDDTRYDRVTFLLQGETARVIGISDFNSGWYYIETQDGKRGFVAPSTVSFSGSLSGLTQIAPPPPPTPIATATPLATATPITSGNLLITGLRLEPTTPVCNEAIAIYINVTNSGTTTTSSGANISIVDTHVASGTTTAQTVGRVPPLAPSENFVSLVYLTVNTYFNEEHRITIVADSSNEVTETNETDNTTQTTYTLAQGGC